MTDQPDPGRIILLNGCSSAGKTTLAITLQQLLADPYQHIALDQFRDGLPGRFRGLNSPPGTPGDEGLNVVPVELAGEQVTEVRFGRHGEQVLRGMRRAIAAFAREGNNVIVDDILFRPRYLDDYVASLSGLCTYFVGVHASRDTVVAREAARPGRFPGTAVSHFDVVHGHHAPYDIEVDTTSLQPRECALQIIERLDRPPTVFDRLRTCR